MCQSSQRLEVDYMRKFIPLCGNKKCPTSLFIVRIYRLILTGTKLRINKSNMPNFHQVRKVA